MNQGRIAQIGSPTDLYDRPASPYVADFIGAANLLEAQALGGGAFRLAGGQTMVSRRADAAAGRKVSLGVRPERLLATAAAGENTLACTVTERLFHGDRLRLELTLDGAAQPLFAEMARTAAVESFAPGSRVTIQVDPADVMVFETGDGR